MWNQAVLDAHNRWTEAKCKYSVIAQELQKTFLHLNRKRILEA